MNKVRYLWSIIINNGVHPELDFDQIIQIRISNAISVIGSLFVIVYVIVLTCLSSYSLAIKDMFLILNMSLLYLFNYIRYYKLCTVLLFITFPFALFMVHYDYGRIGTEYYFYSAIVLCFYYYKKPLNQYLNSFYFIILIFVTKYFETFITPVGFAATYTHYIFTTSILISLTILFVGISLFLKEHKNYQLEIERKNLQLNEALSETNSRNDQITLVLKELNHRVKNNLQMVSSLFNIQSYKTKNEETKLALKDARNRIVSIAILHQKLYKDNLFHEVKLKKYIEELIDYLVQSVGFEENITITLNVEDIKLRIEDTVHIGLTINELITNALKYGINKQNQKNEITVDIFLNDNRLTIKVGDTGNGFPEKFRIENTDSFGLDLVNNIIQQHEGQILITNDCGAKVELQLKLTEFSY